jgi:hypothetical protein
MPNEITQNDTKVQLHPVAPDFSLFIDEHNLVNDFLIPFSVSCLKNNEKIILYFNKKSEYTYLINLEIEDAFLFFIKTFFIKEKIDVFTAFEIISFYEKVSDEETKFYSIFSLLNFPSSKKGMDYFRAFKEFSLKLKTLLKNKKINLSEAFLFHEKFKNGYDEILVLLPENSSCSETSFILRNLSEYAAKENKTADDVAKLLMKEEFKSGKELLEITKRLRFPLYTNCLLKFKSFLKEFDFPKGSEIEFDETFEKNDYTLKVKFKNMKELEKKLDKIKNELERNAGQKDLFLEGNLFK